MLKAEIDETTGKVEITMSGSLLDLMANLTIMLHKVQHSLRSEEKEVFHMILKDIIIKQIYARGEDELDEDEDDEVIERERKFKKIIDKMEEEK